MIRFQGNNIKFFVLIAPHDLQDGGIKHLSKTEQGQYFAHEIGNPENNGIYEFILVQEPQENFGSPRRKQKWIITKKEQIAYNDKIPENMYEI